MMDNFCNTLVPKDTTPEIEIAKLALCNCCYAHKNNKPIVLGVWNELPLYHASVEISNKDSNYIRMCECDCRFKARFICRKFCIN